MKYRSIFFSFVVCLELSCRENCLSLSCTERRNPHSQHLIFLSSSLFSCVTPFPVLVFSFYSRCILLLLLHHKKGRKLGMKGKESRKHTKSGRQRRTKNKKNSGEEEWSGRRAFLHPQNQRISIDFYSESDYSDCSD